MIFLKKSIVVILSMSFLLLMDVNASPNWELKKQSTNIQVYTRGMPNSLLKSFKGTTLVSSRISPLVALLRDKNNYPKWVYNCQSAKSLGGKEGVDGYSYTITKTPWPFLNRDAVVYSTLKQNKKTKEVIISLIAKPNYYPLQKGLVRIQQLKGRWILTPQKNGMIRVTNEIMVDPAGKLPKWLVNQFAVNTPFNTLRGLRKMINDPAYKNIKLNYIVD